MRPLLFIDEKLVKVRSMGLEHIFFSFHSKNNSCDSIKAVKQNQSNIHEVLGAGNELKNQIYNNKSQAHTSNISRKADGSFAEIEKVEY